MRRRNANSRTEQSALMPYRVLFPLAALFALVAVPVSLVFRIRHPTLTVATWHGHEMLFGFALAVIAGFLATRPMRVVLGILVGTWLAARIGATTGGGLPAFLAGVAFPITVLAVAAPPLLRGAKRWENRILPLIVIGLVAADVGWWAGRAWLGPEVQAHALLAAVDLLALLLVVVGGRALRAAVGGHLERRGVPRQDETRFRYELPLAALLGAAALFDAIGIESLAGALCIGAALLTLVRVIPWQLQHTLPHPHLWTLALGYLWLVPGLLLKGLAQLGGTIPVTDVVHGIGVGAVGTLTLVMMARTALLRAHKPIERFSDIAIAAVLVSAAALSRLLMPYAPLAQYWLSWLAAAAWSSAFLILLARLWRTA